MTEAQYCAELRRLKGAVTRARSKAKSIPTLAEKVAQLKLVREAEQALFEHKFNRFELVSNG